MIFDRKKECGLFQIGATLVLAVFFCSKNLSADTSHNPVVDSANISAEAVKAESSGKDDPSGLLSLQKLTVTAPVYKLPRTKLEVWKLTVFFALKSDFGWPPLGGNGGPSVLAPGRGPQRIRNVAPTVFLVESDELRSLPSLRSGNALPFVPDFTFSRRVNGGPYEGNAALRGISALVLLDGVPINHPFDESISWAGIPREGLARAEIVSGGGASAWGNGALGGVIQFLTLPAKGQMTVETGPPPDGGPPDPTLTKQVVHATGQLAASIESFDTRSAGFVTSQSTRSGVFQVLGQVFRSGGYSPIASEQSGHIDRPLWSRNRWLEARWRQPIGKAAELVTTIRENDQSFGGGTPGQYGTSREIFASAALAGSKIGFAWNALAYVQHGSATQTFSAINVERAGEIPVINQFARPVIAFGANWSAAWRHRGDSHTNLGAELRSLSGEIRENLDFTPNAFTHQLVAGGKQAFAGAFLLHDQMINSRLRAILGVRIDRWNETDGHQREIERSAQDPTVDKHFSADHGTESSPSLGLVWQAAKAWRWRINGQQAFRRPTLSERYSVSGVDSVMILGNSNLHTEHNDSIEIATDYSFYRTSGRGPENKSAALIFGARAFSNELHDVAGTVTIPRGTGEFPPLDALPAGYRGERRTNLDRAKIRGFALSSTWNPAKSISLEANLLVSDATIRYVAAAPALSGKEMPNVPRHTASLVAKWKIRPAIQLRVQGRLTGLRFADSENTLVLDSALTVDLTATYTLTARTEFQFMVENIGDRRVQTNVSTTGIFYLDAPRILSGRVRFGW